VVKQKPNTSNVFVDQIIQTAVDKIDLLFMIDNSVSMQDKQEILKKAVPVLVKRLVTPICVDAAGKPTGEVSSGGVCPPGKGGVEFSPIGDIHIGIVSSSLGSHGGDVCATGAMGDTPNDKARLIPSMRSGIPSYNNTGFLAWDASGTKNSPPGETNAANLNKAFQDQIAAVGEHGCGYEASLESWYRFLVDPEPPENVTKQGDFTVRGSALTVNADGTFGACTGCDATLLQQRKQFLRPDSLVAIVMLSDENDCSIRDDQVGWFVGSNGRMPLSTKACDANPNDPCCRSCAQGESVPPTGCQPLTEDGNCKNIPAGGRYAIWDPGHDSLNLRCYNQHQRFGFDLLYDTNRYVSALKNTTIALQSNPKVVITNPLYDSTGSTKPPRDPSLVFLAGIVGVPWQDIADDASLADPTGLTYLTAKQLAEKGRWTVLLGDPKASPPVPPSDPFMIETPLPRSGSNPIVQVAIAPANSTNPKANVINGHEQNIPGFDDLQYACTFPLQQPKTCMNNDTACDCSPDKAGKLDAVVAANSPLCQGPTGTVSAVQTSAKAYPGARELQVLKDFGDNAIVASICPKVTTTADPASDPNYGYNPAVGAIIARLKDALKGKCLPRQIQTDPEGQVLCKVIEAQKADCNCGLAGREIVDPALLEPVRRQLKATFQCGSGTQAPCESWCACEIKQFKGEDLTACQSGGSPNDAGYCYVDKDHDKGALLKDCPENQQQLLRFRDKGEVKTPVQGSVAFIACLGASVEDPNEGE